MLVLTIETQPSSLTLHLHRLLLSSPLCCTAMGLLSDFLSAIPVYTGLSPTAFFTVLAVLFALYYLISGFFAAPRRSDYVPMEPLPPPVQFGDVSEEELLAFDGTDPAKPLLMAIKGQIYDVSQSRMFYGPGGPYALFAGKDASRALAKMSFEEKDLTGDIDGLSPYELDALQDWEWKFMSKYVKVGQIVKEKGETRDIPITEGSDISKDQTSEAPVTETNEEELGGSEHLEGSKE